MTSFIYQPHPAITPASIAQLVTLFYGRARDDALLGAIFTNAVEDWPHHLEQITRFWSAMILKTGDYDGRPLAPHLKLGLNKAHFDRWLSLFEQSALEIFPAPAAAVFITRARRIADSFEMAIATQAGHIAPARHARRTV